MTIEDWLRAATADAERRRLPELTPRLAALAAATRQLRGASWNREAVTPGPAPPGPEVEAMSPGPAPPGPEDEAVTPSPAPPGPEDEAVPPDPAPPGPEDEAVPPGPAPPTPEEP